MVECEYFNLTVVWRGTAFLIDTWWNVNFWSAVYIFSLSSFNRYMVECECKSPHITFLYSLVLIDTWWNVNYYYRWYKHGLYEF